MTLPHGYEMVIGLEVHAQVTTQSKLFSGSPTAFGAEPNTQANEVDLAMPGMLPVLNGGAVDAGIMLGLAIDAEINRNSVFARKNYYYPDLPQGYQISQYDQPIVQRGKLTIDLPDGTSKLINVTRMHLEQDAGKNIHDLGASNVSYVDLNRAGVPLMEIVSEPEISTPEEAGAYVKKLRTLLRFLGICDGDMEKGNLRCDANVSVRKIGSTKLGTRCEVKNLNSIRHIMNAIQYEAERQIDVLENGGEVDQETKLWDPEKLETRTLRSKEDAHDYRYFPCPDLLPVRLQEARIEAIRGRMPVLPDAIRDRYIAELKLPETTARLLAEEKENVTYFEAMLAAGAEPVLAANWMTGELFATLNKDGIALEDSPISAAQLAGLVQHISKGDISGKMAKQVFGIMLENGESASEIIKAHGFAQISDESALRAICEKAVAANPDAVAKFKAGNDRVFGSFVGFVMKETKGQANPELVNKLLTEAITKA